MTSTSTDIVSSNHLKANEQSLCILSSTRRDSLINTLKIEGSNADINIWIDYWYYVGVNVLPATSRQKNLQLNGKNGKASQFLKVC